jgi:selenide,water dikinase
LILTKPIGTGTLLAADMRMKARARWVTAAVEHMTTSNRSAAVILSRHSVHAATDVTGFGLLGHLVEMVKASRVDASLFIASVPLLDGARETLAEGIVSSLQPQNVRLRRAIRNLEEAAEHPFYAMLFDPQTAGGLLASVPASEAPACLAELRVGGYPKAAIVGEVVAASDAIAPIEIITSPAPARSAIMASAPQHREMVDAK